MCHWLLSLLHLQHSSVYLLSPLLIFELAMNQENVIQALKERIIELESEVKLCHQQIEVHRQQQMGLRREIAQKFGRELLALIDGDPRVRFFSMDIVAELEFQDEQGELISETDRILIGRIFEVRFPASFE